MDGPTAGAIARRYWFRALIAGSAALLLITIASYALVDKPSVARVLFWLGLGGEQNIGAWWSGMLFVLAAFLVFDGFFDSARSEVERKGWLALGFALLLLSFDEIASLHEYLSLHSLKLLALLGATGLALASYSMSRLYRAGVPRRTLLSLLFGFGLLASVPVHEFLQHTLQWNDPLIYGVRAFSEEGTEILAMLIFVSVGRKNSSALWRSSHDFGVALVRRRQLVTLTALLLWPALSAATLVLQRPGPADWLASALFLASALLAARGGLLRGGLDSRSLSLILLYMAASAAASAVSFRWDPLIGGAPISIRGLVFAVLVLNALAVMKANGRPVKNSPALIITAAIAAGAIAWPSSQILWCALPPALALVVFGIEAEMATRCTTAPLARAMPVRAGSS